MKEGNSVLKVQRDDDIADALHAFTVVDAHVESSMADLGKYIRELARTAVEARNLRDATREQVQKLETAWSESQDEALRAWAAVAERDAELARLTEENRALSAKFAQEQDDHDEVIGHAERYRLRIERLEKLLREMRDLMLLADPDGDRAQHVHAPEDDLIGRLCEEYGYGAVIDAAARLWRRKDDSGAFLVGMCAGIVRPVLIRVNAALDADDPNNLNPDVIA